MVTKTTQIIPPWLRHRLSLADIHGITHAIHAAESDTDAEIVPIIVHRSVMTSHIGTICTLILWLLALATAAVFELHERWWEIGLGLVLLALFGWYLGNRDWLIRLLTPHSDIERLVWQRAQAEFFQQGIGRTQRSTGILLFLSMAEHRAVVLPDHAIAARYSSENWQNVVEMMISGLKQNQLGAGLSAAIDHCGTIIKPHFPKVNDAGNELADRLIIAE